MQNFLSLNSNYSLFVFSGHAFLKEGVIVDLQKIEAVKNWIRSNLVTRVRSFVGLLTIIDCL